MKKITVVLSLLLFILTSLYPMGALIFSFFEYSFEPVNIYTYLFFGLLVSVCAVVSSLFAKDRTNNKTISILFSLLPLLSLINAFFCIAQYSKIRVIICVFASFGCCCFLANRCGNPKKLKNTVLIISALMTIPLAYFSFIALIFGNFGLNTIVQTAESPNGKYYAEVIASDQGALGGDTFVDVYEKSEINPVFFRIEKKPQRVYFGEWYEFENMVIYWKNDSCLVINLEEYEIE